LNQTDHSGREGLIKAEGFFRQFDGGAAIADEKSGYRPNLKVAASWHFSTRSVPLGDRLCDRLMG
jgi:hypothetical protein